MGFLAFPSSQDLTVEKSWGVCLPLFLFLLRNDVDSSRLEIIKIHSEVV